VRIPNRALCARPGFAIRLGRRGLCGPRGSELLSTIQQLQRGRLPRRSSERQSRCSTCARCTSNRAHADAKRRQPARRPLPRQAAARARRRALARGVPALRGRLRTLGEDVTETLERVPTQWKVIQTCSRGRRASHDPAPPLSWRSQASAAWSGYLIRGYGQIMAIEIRRDLGKNPTSFSCPSDASRA
jgi:hypothetical protein